MDGRIVLFLGDLRDSDRLNERLLLLLLNMLCLNNWCEVHTLCKKSCELIMVRMIHASFGTSCEVQSRSSKTALWQVSRLYAAVQMKVLPILHGCKYVPAARRLESRRQGYCNGKNRSGEQEEAKDSWTAKLVCNVVIEPASTKTTKERKI